MMAYNLGIAIKQIGHDIERQADLGRPSIQKLEDGREVTHF